LGYKKGYSVTFIDSHKPFEPGDEAVIARVDGDSAWVVRNDFMLKQLDKEDTDEKQDNWLNEYAIFVPLKSITKQRLQFNAGLVTQQSAEDAGRQAGHQIIGIVNAWKNKEWPNTFGIRYPRDDKNDPYFRAFIYGDEAYKKSNFTKSDEESFDNLFEDTD